MNPTLAQTLDPKLKEAYDRVMGTEVGGTNRVRLQSESFDKGGSSPASEFSTQAQPPAPSTPPPPATSQAPAPIEQEHIYHAQTQPTTTTTVSVEKKFKISWWVFVLMGLAFFIVYTLVWVRVFNVSLPF